MPRGTRPASSRSRARCGSRRSRASSHRLAGGRSRCSRHGRGKRRPRAGEHGAQTALEHEQRGPRGRGQQARYRDRSYAGEGGAHWAGMEAGHCLLGDRCGSGGCRRRDYTRAIDLRVSAAMSRSQDVSTRRSIVAPTWTRWHMALTGVLRERHTRGTLTDNRMLRPGVRAVERQLVSARQSLARRWASYPRSSHAVLRRPGLAAHEHAVCMVDERGKVVAQFTVEHTAVGMTELGLSKAAGLTVAVKRLAWISTAGRSPNAWRIR